VIAPLGGDYYRADIPIAATEELYLPCKQHQKVRTKPKRKPVLSGSFLALQGSGGPASMQDFRISSHEQYKISC